MSIELDAEGKAEFRKELGKRLRAARKGAGLTEMDACRAVGQKEQTQVSLWETGDRLPPMLAVVKLAKLYCVPTDYLLQLHDDPIADPMETNQGVVVSAVKTTITSSFQLFCEMIGQQVAVTVDGFNTDRQELIEMCSLSREALAAVNRLIELNPEFEEEWRGSAAVMRTLHRMQEKSQDFTKRLEAECLRKRLIDQQVSHTEMHEKAEQFMLSFAP